MAIKDKIKWDKKYQDKPSLLEHREASPKLEKIIKKTKGKRALEIACGSGRNSIYLAKEDFYVDAYDISKVAINSLNQKAIKNIIQKS